MAFKITITFQSQVLGLIINDAEILDKYRGSFSPDFFEYPPYKNICQLILNYYDSYNGVPSRDSLQSIVENFLYEDPSHQAYQQVYMDTVTRIFQKLTDADSAFIRANLETAIRQRMMQQAIIRASTLIEDGSGAEIVDMVDKAASFGFVSDQRTIHWEKMEHFVYSTEPEEIPIPTGFNGIDADLHGGIRPGEMGFVVAPSGRGKSHILHNIAKGALSVGKRVHYYTLELTEKQVVRRLDANIGDTPFWDLRQPEAEATAFKRVTKFISDHPGASFTVSFFPAKSVSVRDISQHIKRMRSEYEPADLILIDYGDIIKPSHTYNNSYDEQGSIYQDLVGLAQTWKVGLWTAAQSNRAGFNAQAVAMEMLSDSIKKAFVADYVFLFGQTKEERSANIFRLHGAKVRSHESNGEYLFRCDLSKSRIWEIGQNEYVSSVPTTEEVATMPVYNGKIETKPKEINLPIVKKQGIRDWQNDQQQIKPLGASIRL